jgi:hypothetical protein
VACCGVWNDGCVLERYLADLDRLRAGVVGLDAVELAVAVVEDRMRSRTAGRQASILVWASAEPTRRDRARWSFAVPPDAAVESGTFTIGVVHGALEPGAGVAVTVNGVLVLPAGPLRPLMRGARWRPMV